MLGVDKVMFARMTLGVHAGFEADDYDDAGVKAFLAGVRGGWLFCLGNREDVELWPRLGLTYGKISYQFGGLGGGQYTTSVVRLVASVPIVWRPVSRFFLGGGPVFEYDVFAQVGRDQEISKTTTIGVQGLLGAYFYGY